MAPYVDPNKAANKKAMWTRYERNKAKMDKKVTEYEGFIKKSKEGMTSLLL